MYSVIMMSCLCFFATLKDDGICFAMVDYIDVLLLSIIRTSSIL